MTKQKLAWKGFAVILVILPLLYGGLKNDTKNSIDSDYGALVALFEEFRAFMKPTVTDGIPDYTAEAMQRQHRELKDLQRRLSAIDISRWPVSEQIGYHIVRAEMNGLEFNHRVLRPWARDPGFYCTIPRFEETMEGAVRIPRRLPIPEDRLQAFRAGLKALPRILAQAKDNLTEVPSDLALLALKMKKREHDMFTELAGRLKENHPDLIPEVEGVIAAIDDFQGWLEDNRGRMAAPAGVGIENYNWYLKNVYLFPYTWEECRAIVQRELERSQEYLLDFLRKEQLFTVPDDMQTKPPPGYRRPDGFRNFFEECLDRDPLPLIAHDIVGHTPDARRQAQDDRPIRGVGRPYHIAGIRAEALATGIEELLTHAGLLDERRRSRELMYILVAFRASRAAADLLMHSNELSFEEALRYTAEMTPRGYAKADSFLVWDDLELYIRQPGYGMGYLMGKVQLDKLLADYSRLQGKEFSLKRFFDDFFAAGMAPVSLIRWEMTGQEDEIRKLW